MFKYAVDALTADPSGAVLAATPFFPVVPAAALLGYGAARATSSLCNELRNAVFAKVRHTILRPQIALFLAFRGALILLYLPVRSSISVHVFDGGEFG